MVQFRRRRLFNFLLGGLPRAKSRLGGGGWWWVPPHFPPPSSKPQTTRGPLLDFNLMPIINFCWKTASLCTRIAHQFQYQPSPPPFLWSLNLQSGCKLIIFWTCQYCHDCNLDATLTSLKVDTLDWNFFRPACNCNIMHSKTSYPWKIWKCGCFH